MLYVIGGASRSGKTTSAKRMLQQTGIPYFSLDYLMMGIANGVPSLHVDPDEGDHVTGQRLWNIVKPLMTAMVENEIDYILEGVQLLPGHVSQFERAYPEKVKSCFIGMADIQVEDLDQVRFYSSQTENDGFQGRTEAEAKAELERIRTDSIRIKEECRIHHLPYFESSQHFNETIDKVLAFLWQDAKSR